MGTHGRMTQPIGVLSGLEALDRPAKALAAKARELIPRGPVKEALSGTWLGHPLHPLLTDLTLGTLSSAVLLDWLGGKQSAAAAERLIALGLLSAAPTVASGYSDWGDAEPGSDAVRRIGIVHDAANATGATLFATSLAARRRGRRGRLLALAGGGVMAAAGYLGGHLAFGEGVRVDRTVFEDDDTGWTAVLDDVELAEGQARCVHAEHTAVMVTRSGGELFALSDHCSHLGGPLHEGTIRDGTVTCPLHDSVFALRDGALIHGPAAYPQPAWDARVRAGRIEVRRR